MPHDANKEELHIGDTVTIQAVVTRIEQTAHYCNITVETTRRMPPNDGPTSITLNSTQVVRSS